MHKLLSVFFPILGICSFLYPQVSYTKFERISVEQGLSESKVTCFVQDSQGFLWIGTLDGLNKYDGYTFTVFRNDPTDSTSISSSRIWSILKDSEGMLWVGTLNGGLNMFDPQTEQFTHYMNNPENPNSLSHNAVTAIAEDKAGNLWIGTLRGGLNKFEKKTKRFTRYRHDGDTPKGLSHNSVMALCMDKSGTLWVGTWGGGLCKLDPKTEKFTSYTYDPRNPNSLSSNVVWSIIEDQAGLLWIGTMGGGLNRFDPQKNIFTRYQYDPRLNNSISQNDINTIYEDHHQRLWIGTWGGGLCLFDRVNGRFKTYKHNPSNPSGISHNEIKSIYEDNSCVMWIGTNGGGLNRLDFQKNQFAHFRRIPGTNSLSHNDVWAIYEDRSGNVWIGTVGGGLNKFDPETQTFVHYKHDPGKPNSISHNSIISIVEDFEGRLWIGTINGGLNRYNPGTRQFTRYLFDPDDPTSVGHDFISNLYVDGSGDLWIGTWGGGLCKYNRAADNFSRFRHDPENKNSLSDNIIWDIYEDKAGILWIATETGGLNRFDRRKNIFTHYMHNPAIPNSLSSNTVWAILEDKAGTLWIGTGGGGLNRFIREEERFVKYSVKDGLPSDMINTIVEDHNGNLWLSTNKGLSKFNPESEEFKNYDVNDGLQSNQFTFTAGYKRKNGELLFGGINGFNIFHPDSIKDNPHTPRVLLTRFQIFNKPVLPGMDSPLKRSISVTKEITLTSMQSVFSLEFAALDYHSPLKNKYAYKMDGVDPDWVYTDAGRRFATYTNLDPGQYTFRVKGSNNDGIWNERETSLNVVILPPWWKTSGAIFSYLILLAGLLYSLRRYDMKRQRLRQELAMEHFQVEKLNELDKMKSRFFANISHEFRTPLTLIKGPVQRMLDGEFSGNIREQYKMILRNSDRLLGLINQILDLSKLESGNVKLEVSERDVIPFLKGIVSSFSSLAERMKITLTFKTREKSLMAYVDGEKLEKILTNLLSNAFKFTPGGGVIELSVSCPPAPPGALEGQASPSLRDSGAGAERDRMEIRVTNSGHGIPADHVGKIFDRFYQGDDRYYKDHPGSGIGLALTRELVEAHKGTISVESIPEQTTSFRVTLPIAREFFDETERVEPSTDASPFSTGETAAFGEPPPLSTIEAGLSAPRVLIVEDNADVTCFICSFLEDHYKIMSAGNGREGWQKALDKYPDLIISDIMMPEMDGFELCKRIKSDERVCHIPVILLTARADAESKIEGLEFGADAYVTKPFEARELQARCQNLIDQRRRLREKFARHPDIPAADMAVTSMDEHFLNRFMSEFERHMAEPELSTEQIARAVGMSRSNLNRKLKALTGRSTHEFIRAIRLKRAARLLKQSAGSVAEVAYRVGFNNTSHFAKAFRQMFGQSPSEFLSNDE